MNRTRSCSVQRLYGMSFLLAVIGMIGFIHFSFVARSTALPFGADRECDRGSPLSAVRGGTGDATFFFFCSNCPKHADGEKRREEKKRSQKEKNAVGAALPLGAPAPRRSASCCRCTATGRNS